MTAVLSDHPDELARLRREAEDILRRRPGSASFPTNDIHELIHELSVHQEELRLQNDNLKQAHQQLMDLNQGLEELYEFAPCGYLTLNPSGLIQRVNLTGTILLGMDRVSLKTERFSRLLDPQSEPGYFRALEEARRTGDRQRLELKTKPVKDRQRWIQLDIQPVFCQEGGIDQWRLILLDISERHQAEEKLRLSEALFRNLFENVAIGVAMISPDMEILRLNKKMKQWFPTIVTENRPLCYRSFNNPPQTAVCAYCPTIQTLRDGQIHECVTETPAGDEIRNYRIVSSPILDAFGNIAAAIEMVDDVTEEKHATEEIRNLTHKLFRAYESERLRLSRELHDSLAQNLAAAKIKCDTAIGQNLPEGTVAVADLKSISDIIKKCIADVRGMAYELRPPGIRHWGIAATLANYCREFMEIHGVAVDFEASGIPQNLGEEMSINLYRLVQEAMSNVLKHACASQVRIRLAAAANRICLSIEDNGRGFDPKKRQNHNAREKKLGLRGMKERADLIKGTMKIMSQPGLGTRITIKIPMEETPHGLQKKHRNRR